MSFIGSLITFFLFFYYVNSDNLNTAHHIVKSALEHYQSRSVVLILNTNRSSDFPLLRLQKELSSTNNLYFSSLTSMSEVSNSMRNIREGLRETAVVLDPNETEMKFLGKVSNRTGAQKWLLTTSRLTLQDFDNLTIPFNSEFIIASGNFWSGYDLVEIYDVRPGRRTTNSLGRWVVGDRFHLNGDLFKRRRNLQGAAIKVVSPKKDSCDGTSFSGGIASIVWCIHQKLWGVMSEMINATTELQIVPNLTPDVIQNADAELTFRSAPLNADDIHTRTYVWPIFRVKVEVVTSYEVQQVEWETYVLPFSQRMWAMVLVWLVAADFVLAFVEFVAKRKETGVSFLGYCTEFCFSGLFSFCSQGVLGSSKLFSTRIVLLMMFIVPGVLFPGYSAVLTSYLTIHLDKKPFRSLEELSRTSEYKLGWHNTFALEHMFNLKDTSPLNRALLENNVLPREKLPATDAEGVERMCTQKFSFLTITDTILALKPKCRYYTLDHHFKLVFTSMEMKKGSWYKHFLDRCARILEFSGIMRRIKVTAVMKYVWYDDQIILDKSDVPPIHLDNIVLPFAVLLLGVTASAIILFFEIITFKQTHTTKCNLIRT